MILVVISVVTHLYMQFVREVQFILPCCVPHNRTTRKTPQCGFGHHGQWQSPLLLHLLPCSTHNNGVFMKIAKHVQTCEM